MVTQDRIILKVFSHFIRVTIYEINGFAFLKNIIKNLDLCWFLILQVI